MSAYLHLAAVTPPSRVVLVDVLLATAMTVMRVPMIFATLMILAAIHPSPAHQVTCAIFQVATLFLAAFLLL